MTLSEIADSNLRLSARRAYEIGRFRGSALARRGRGPVRAAGLPDLRQRNPARGALPRRVRARGRSRTCPRRSLGRRLRAREPSRESRPASSRLRCAPSIPRALREAHDGHPWPCAVGGLAAGAILALRGPPRRRAALLDERPRRARLRQPPSAAFPPAPWASWALLAGVIAGGAPVLVATAIARDLSLRLTGLLSFPSS